MDSDEIAAMLTAAALRNARVRFDAEGARAIAAFWRHLVTALEDPEQEGLPPAPRR